MPKKMKKKGNPTVHNELEGFDIRINPFGELQSNFEVDKINSFLNENTDDKKLKEKSSDEQE